MRRLLPRLLLAALALALPTVARAQSSFTVNITVNESGQGRFTNSNGFNQALTGTMATDPGPGGLSSALTYDLLNPPGLVSGDLFIRELDGTLSDVIRFNSLGANSGSLVFYSALGGSQLADTGFPTSAYTNTFSLSEVPLGALGNGAVYTPVQGQPGFVTGAGGPVTYTIISDAVTPTPEPASLALLASGLLGMLGAARTMRRTRLTT